jgi:hypothetical protein
MLASITQFSARFAFSQNSRQFFVPNFAAFHTNPFILGQNKKSAGSEPATTTTMPIKVLNVAEKNDAAKNIAQLLSRGSARRVKLRLKIWHC